MRKGALNQTAVGLYLFLRDVCGGDFVGWLDERLEAADRGAGRDRAATMRRAVIEPMANIHGVSDKVLAMALSGLLIAGDATRERWLATGVSMIAVDTLVHNFLHRTGMLRRHDAEHTYGPACYGPNGCADLIEAFAAGIDARTINPAFPSYFPRFIQYAIWHFCAEGGRSICNGRKIDDRAPCKDQFCPCFRPCSRLALRAAK